MINLWNIYPRTSNAMIPNVEPRSGRASASKDQSRHLGVPFVRHVGHQMQYNAIIKAVKIYHENVGSQFPSCLWNNQRLVSRRPIRRILYNNLRIYLLNPCFSFDLTQIPNIRSIFLLSRRRRDLYMFPCLILNRKYLGK